MGERARYTLHGDTHSLHDTPAAGGIVGNAYIGTFILNSFADVVTMEFWCADAIAGLYFDRPSLPLVGMIQDGSILEPSPDHIAEERFRKMCNSYGFIDMKNECVKENHFTPMFNNNDLPERRPENAV